MKHIKHLNSELLQTNKHHHAEYSMKFIPSNRGGTSICGNKTHRNECKSMRFSISGIGCHGNDASEPPGPLFHHPHFDSAMGGGGAK